jgi:hypothetical protein
MDITIVRTVLAAIAENNASQIEPGQPVQAVAWLKQRIWIEPHYTVKEPMFNEGMELVWRAAEKAVALYERGDFEAAKPLALEALKPLGANQAARISTV